MKKLLLSIVFVLIGAAIGAMFGGAGMMIGAGIGFFLAFSATN